MVKMFKNGKECIADPLQVSAMEAGGWSTTKPKVKKAAKKETADKPKTVKKVKKVTNRLKPSGK